MGLTPDQFYEMTFREFELYLEGYQDRVDQVLEILSWVQANLINIHIPRGKPRVTPEKIKPRSIARRQREREQSAGREVEEETIDTSQLDSALNKATDPKERARLARQRAKQKREMAEQMKDADSFWNSSEGKRAKAILEDED